MVRLVEAGIETRLTKKPVTLIRAWYPGTKVLYHGRERPGFVSAWFCPPALIGWLWSLDSGRCMARTDFLDIHFRNDENRDGRWKFGLFACQTFDVVDAPRAFFSVLINFVFITNRPTVLYKTSLQTELHTVLLVTNSWCTASLHFQVFRMQNTWFTIDVLRQSPSTLMVRSNFVYAPS